MAHGEQPLTTAVLIHQLPDAFAEKAIEILETNEVLSRSSVKTTKTSVMGTEFYLDSELSLERAVFYGAVTIFTTSYRIYPLVTDLTVHGAQAHMRREDLKRHMQRLGPVLFVYEEKGTNNYRVIIHHPEIPEKVLGWPKSCDVIFKDGLKYPITFFCRFCRTHGHLRCQCDRVKGKITEKKPKLCLKKFPKVRSSTECCTPSPSSSSREHNEYRFQSNKTLLRNSKAMTLSRTISQVPIPSTNCDSNDPSDGKKLTKKFHKQKYHMELKKEKPDFNKSSVKRKLDSSIEVNGAKRKTLQQIKGHKLKKVHPDSGLPDHTMESAKNLPFSKKKENEASDKDLNQMKEVKYPGKEETTHLVPIVNPILSGVSRKISDSAKGITQAGSRGLKGEENNTKHLRNLKLKHSKDQTSILKSSSKTSILPSSHPDFSNSLLKSNFLGEDFLTVEKLNDIINHVKKNRIIQEMALKSSKEENTDQLTEQESTKKKIHRENARFNKSVIFKYVRKQPGKMAKQTCDAKIQGMNSVPNLPHDTQLKNKEKDLYPVKNIEEPSMDNHVSQEKTVCDGSSSSSGFGISDTRETGKVRRKSTNPITSETMKKIIQNSSGELSQSALKAFFVQVVNRKKPLELARNYSKNVDLIIRQLNCIVMDYFNGQERVPKAEVEIRWIKSLIKRMETEKKATSQANKSVITVPISERFQIRVKKEICN